MIRARMVPQLAKSAAQRLHPAAGLKGVQNWHRAAAAFHYGATPRTDVAYISDAYRLLSPAVGTLAAKILFGVALLASGQNSTITGTLAGAKGLGSFFLRGVC